MKRLILQALTLSAHLLTVTACGNSATRDVRPSDPEIPRQVIAGNEVESYGLHDPECQTSIDSSEKLQSATLHQWLRGTVSPVYEDVSPLSINMRPLQGKITSRVLTGAIFRRICDSSAAPPPQCLNHSGQDRGFNVLSEGQPVKICDANITPREYSIEHLALSAITSLEATARSLAGLWPAGVSPPAVSVLITPRFESHWMPWTHGGESASYETILAENVAYFPSNGQSSPYVAIFPKQKSPLNPVNLWETRFVFAHEFSHHVEASLGLDHFNSRRSVMRTAVSEGFADVLAFASLDAKNDTLRGIPCLGSDRAPDTLEFSSGMAKTLTSAILSRVSDKNNQTMTTIPASDSCQGLLPSSAHGIGAIFAHWMWELGSLTPSYGTDHKSALILVAVNWLREVESRIKSGQANPNADLKAIALAMESTINQRFQEMNEPIPPNIRALLRQKMGFAFPTITDHEWFTESLATR